MNTNIAQRKQHKKAKKVKPLDAFSMLLPKHGATARIRDWWGRKKPQESKKNAEDKEEFEEDEESPNGFDSIFGGNGDGGDDSEDEDESDDPDDFGVNLPKKSESQSSGRKL